MSSTTWVLIAGSSRALLYGAYADATSWRLLREYTHPASRVTEGGLTSDQAGRTQSSMGGGARSAMESRTSPKEVEFEHFAHELAKVLHDGHGQQAYGRLVLVAPPHFLGLLRKSIDAAVSKLVIATLDKDYLHLTEMEMRRHVDPLMARQEATA